MFAAISTILDPIVAIIAVIGFIAIIAFLPFNGLLNGLIAVIFLLVLYGIYYYIDKFLNFEDVHSTHAKN